MKYPIVAQTMFLGKEITIYRTDEGTGTDKPHYTIYTDGICGQYELTAEEVIAWMANAMMNAGSKK